jgi:hypothetical protein
MKSHHTVKKDLFEADVVVIGAGMAGIGAAVAAARENLRVCLVEASNQIGGVMAVCPGMPIGAAYPCGQTVGGILEEFVQQLYAMKPPAAEKRACVLHEFGPEILYDHEIAIATLNRIVKESGVNLLLNTTAFEAVMENNRVKSVCCSNKNGLQSVSGRLFIDCSGDGYLASKAGVPYQKGDDNSNMMGATLTFIMDNVDWDTVFTNNDDPYFTAYARKGIAEGKLHRDLHKLYIMKGFYEDTVFFNSVVINNFDGSDPDQVTSATGEARDRCHQLAEFVRSEIPGFEKARMIYLGPAVGVRETRKFEGLYRLTAEDLSGARKFSDGVVACDNPVDDVFRGSNVMTHESIVKDGDYYTIPFRTMVPKIIDNLLFAGRLISADPVAFASVRGMSQCMLMGQACGVAAKQIIDQGTNAKVQEFDAHKLVAALTQAGVTGLNKHDRYREPDKI